MEKLIRARIQAKDGLIYEYVIELNDGVPVKGHEFSYRNESTDPVWKSSTVLWNKDINDFSADMDLASAKALYENIQMFPEEYSSITCKDMD